MPDGECRERPGEWAVFPGVKSSVAGPGSDFSDVPREIRACEGHMVDTCGTVAPLGLPSGYSGAAWRIHGQGGMRNVRV